MPCSPTNRVCWCSRRPSRARLPPARPRCRSARWRRTSDCAPEKNCATSAARPQSSRRNSSSDRAEQAARTQLGDHAVLTSIKRIAVAALFALAAAPAFAETTITFAGYTGLFQDLYTKAVIEPFMKANPDIKVVYYAPGNSAAILGALRAQKSAPQIDV